MNQINPIWLSMSYILPELGSKAQRRLKRVWIIGALDLDIVCYLLFGAWNLLNSGTPLYLDTKLLLS